MIRHGNTAERWKHRARSAVLHRRIAVALRADAPDLGNRPELEQLFGFGDPRGLDGTPERFRWLARLWFGR